jgi:hypothetical protein
MSCDQSACATPLVAATQPLTLTATNLGLSPADVADVVAKFGEPVLQLIVQGLRGGLTWSFLKSILDTLGPLFVGFAVQAYTSSTHLFGATAPSPIIEGTQVGAGPFLNILLKLLADYLPQLVQQYGPQIIDAVIKILVDALNSNQGRTQLNAALMTAMAAR